MRVRTNVRLLILNPAGEILLMKYHDHRLTNPDGSRPAPFWGTLGGGVEDGESLTEAAAREAREETGRADVRIGPAVWYGEVTLTIKGIPTLLRETYFVAWLDGGPLSRDRWQALEHEVVKEIRWWPLGELRTTNETVYPPGIANLLPSITRGEYPDPVTVFDPR